MKNPLIILLTLTAILIIQSAFAVNHVLSLNGGGDYARIPNASELHVGENGTKTIEAWFMPKKIPFPIVGKTLDHRYKGWAILLNGKGQIQFHSRVRSEN